MEESRIDLCNNCFCSCFSRTILTDECKLVSLIFNIDIIPALIISYLFLVYLVKGGFRSNVYVDAFQFFVMFAGFILILIFAGVEFGSIDFISSLFRKAI